ncbi:MAG TPA: phasin family protein [Casimicrobiaceae bacterium]|nr:phasin family protein [Casimicrobiaceae bacterium]
MLKATPDSFGTARMTSAGINAPRQLWLAGLGAATVTRQWAVNDAGHLFRSLVREGTVVENRARRVIGKQVDDSLALAIVACNKARRVALSTIGELAGTAASALPRLRVPRAKAAPAKANGRSTPRKARKARRSR